MRNWPWWARFLAVCAAVCAAVIVAVIAVLTYGSMLVDHHTGTDFLVRSVIAVIFWAFWTVVLGLLLLPVLLGGAALWRMRRPTC
jgi:chromate transport protein ChrA